MPTLSEFKNPFPFTFRNFPLALVHHICRIGILKLDFTVSTCIGIFHPVVCKLTTCLIRIS
jgi:hypothetical protein